VIAAIDCASRSSPGRSGLPIRGVGVERSRRNLPGVPGLLAKLDHCVIHVSDWEISNPFYRDVLGAELIDGGHGTWAYRFGSEQLNVHGPGVIADPVARIPVAAGNSDLCFEWDGRIEAAVEHLKRRGVEIEVGPAERDGARGRGTSVYFRDPDGSLMEFISYRS
jgi:catechol 2,3-dioxygenase-like lactoylglutathione lyase family enzyme